MGSNFYNPKMEFDPNNPYASIHNLTLPSKGESISNILGSLAPVVASFNKTAGFRNQALANEQMKEQEALNLAAQEKRGTQAFNILKALKPPKQDETNDIQDYNFYLKNFRPTEKQSSPMPFEHFRIMKNQSSVPYDPFNAMLLPVFQNIIGQMTPSKNKSVQKNRNISPSAEENLGTYDMSGNLIK